MSQRNLPGWIGFQGAIITGFKDGLARPQVDAGLENIVNRKTQPTKLFELICARPISKLLLSFSRTFETLTASASVRGCCFNWVLPPLILILYGPFEDSWPTMYAIVKGETSGAHLCASPATSSEAGAALARPAQARQARARTRSFGCLLIYVSPRNCNFDDLCL